MRSTHGRHRLLQLPRPLSRLAQERPGAAVQSEQPVAGTRHARYAAVRSAAWQTRALALKRGSPALYCASRRAAQSLPASCVAYLSRVLPPTCTRRSVRCALPSAGPAGLRLHAASLPRRRRVCCAPPAGAPLQRSCSAPTARVLRPAHGGGAFCARAACAAQRCALYAAAKREPFDPRARSRLCCVRATAHVQAMVSPSRSGADALAERASGAAERLSYLAAASGAEPAASADASVSGLQAAARAPSVRTRAPPPRLQSAAAAAAALGQPPSHASGCALSLLVSRFGASLTPPAARRPPPAAPARAPTWPRRWPPPSRGCAGRPTCTLASSEPSRCAAAWTAPRPRRAPTRVCPDVTTRSALTCARPSPVATVAPRRVSLCSWTKTGSRSST
jgi:hypothetical protein